VLAVTLGPGSERIGRNRLGEMITHTALQATRNAAELDTAQQELLHIIESIDSMTAAAMRRARTRTQAREHSRIRMRAPHRSHVGDGALA
jgi:hypothetical protein